MSGLANETESVRSAARKLREDFRALSHPVPARIDDVAGAEKGEGDKKRKVS